MSDNQGKLGQRETIIKASQVTVQSPYRCNTQRAALLCGLDSPNQCPTKTATRIYEDLPSYQAADDRCSLLEDILDHSGTRCFVVVVVLWNCNLMFAQFGTTANHDHKVVNINTTPHDPETSTKR
jgi:hypothetical protein